MVEFYLKSERIIVRIGFEIVVVKVEKQRNCSLHVDFIDLD